MVIDFRVRAPSKEALEMPDKLSQYFNVFEEQFGFDDEFPETEWIKNMRQAGVETAVVTAEDTETTTGKKISNEQIAELVDRYPDQLIGFASVDPNKGMGAVEELEYALTELGMEGVIVWPPFHELETIDRRYYPIYAKAAEHDVPVIIHTSAHFNRDVPVDIGHPRQLDDVATDFQDLSLVCSHAGWPWIMEAVTVAIRHPNIYLETSGIHPRYLATTTPDVTDAFGPSPEWQTFLQYAESTLQEQLLFGTGKPVITWDSILEAFDELPIDDETKQRWLTDNAADLLGL